MPNNCSSIIKKISYVFFLFVIVSCASINNDYKTTPYTGKVLINQNNNELSSFNISLKIANDITIIQLKKPLYGNVLEIKIEDGKNLTFLPSELSEPFFVTKSINRNFKYWIRQCIFSNNLNVVDDYEGVYFAFECFKDDLRTNFSIIYQEYYLKGFVEKQ